MITEGSSGSVVKDVGVRNGSNWGKLFLNIFLPCSDCSIIDYLDPTILYLFGFSSITL